MLIDSHTHFFSYPFFEALAMQSPQPGTVEDRLEALAARTGLEIPDPDVERHVTRWLAEFDDAGVDHAVTFASLPQEADAVAAAVALAPDRFTGYALVNPNAEGAADVTRLHFEEHGFKGILLFPAMHHFRAGDENARKVLAVVAEHGGVALVHCGMLQVKLRDLLGLPRPFDLSYANPVDLVPAANAFPDVHFVIPHFGAGLFRECLMTGMQCENVYVDTSSSNAWMPTQPDGPSLEEVFDRALDVFGPERILFGTDSSTFPRGWRDELHTRQAEAFATVGLSDADLDLVFGGNAARILGLRKIPRPEGATG